MALDIELYRRTLYAPARDRWQSPETVADRSLIVTIQVLDSSPHVLDKSALYSGSRLFVLRAWQPQAAMPAAQKPLANHRRVPIYRARVVRSSE